MLNMYNPFVVCGCASWYYMFSTVTTCVHDNMGCMVSLLAPWAACMCSGSCCNPPAVSNKIQDLMICHAYLGATYFARNMQVLPCSSCSRQIKMCRPYRLFRGNKIFPACTQRIVSPQILSKGLFITADELLQGEGQWLCRYRCCAMLC